MFSFSNKHIFSLCCYVTLSDKIMHFPTYSPTSYQRILHLFTLSVHVSVLINDLRSTITLLLLADNSRQPTYSIITITLCVILYKTKQKQTIIG